MKVEMIVEKTNTGYSSYAQKYPVFTVGSTLEELKVNMLEAINLYFEVQGKMVTEDDLRLKMDLQ